jgi:hypothetical protein
MCGKKKKEMMMCDAHCRQGRDSPELLNVAAWQLLNQLGSEILLRFPFVQGRRKAGFNCPDIWHSPMLAENLLHKRLVDTGVKTLPKQLLYIGEFPLCMTDIKGTWNQSGNAV